MRYPKTRPLLVALAACLLFALLGSALVGGSIEDWYMRLEKPGFLVPLWVFYLVGAIYYVMGATVLYRILVHVEDRGARLVCLSMALGVLLANELWNYAFFGLRSTLAGFVGIALFLVPLTALIAGLYRHERVSAWILSPYYAWVLYDLAWTYELWRLNGGA